MKNFIEIQTDVDSTYLLAINSIVKIEETEGVACITTSTEVIRLAESYESFKARLKEYTVIIAKPAKGASKEFVDELRGRTY